MNIGYGKDYKMIDVSRKIIAHYGSNLEPRFVPQYEGDFARTLCDNELARRALGWRPEVRFEDGLELFLNWFDKNRLPTAGEKSRVATQIPK